MAEADLASQIADLLIRETADEENLKVKKSPFVKEALPGEKQTYHNASYYKGICQFSAIFYINLNIFVNVFVYQYWAEGNGIVVTISVL